MATFSGTTGNDTLTGGAEDDLLEALAGNDLLSGEAGDDTLKSGKGNDTLFGGDGNDTVSGGDGDDEIYGGAGDDELSGGDGADSFYFGGAHGTDTVSDFETETDILLLADTTAGFTSMDDVVEASSTATVDGQAGVLIETGDDASIFLVGVDLDAVQNLNVTF